MTRLRRIRDRLALPVGILFFAVMILVDGRRLHASALWGTAGWLWGALAGTAVGGIGVILAVVAIRRERSDRGSGRRKHVVGLTYTVGMTVVFFATHRKSGPQPRVDSPFTVAALAAQIVLAVLLVVLSVMLVARRAEDAPISGD